MNPIYNQKEIEFNKAYKFNQKVKNMVFENHLQDLEGVRDLFAPIKVHSVCTDSPEKLQEEELLHFVTLLTQVVADMHVYITHPVTWLM